MKTHIYLAISVMFLISSLNKTIAQSANKKLSNLIYPTSVNVSLLPAGSGIDLGSTNKSWQNIYLYSEIFWKGFHFISASNNTANTFVGIDAGAVVTSGTANSFFGDEAG